jgi:uncharacterized membrane protein YdjX (TVP38/TMEM64 family)
MNRAGQEMKPPIWLRNIRAQGLRLLMLAVLVSGVLVFLLLGGYREFTFEKLVARKDALVGLAAAHPVLAILAFVAAYLILGLFGLPGSTVLNLTAGLLFRFWLGLLLVVVASTLACSLAFLSFRYLFRSFVEAKARRFFPRLEQELQRQDAYFVFAMRLFPVIPYSFTNLVLAVSPVRFGTYLWVTLLAMLPRYLLYVYGGTHLGEVRDPDDLLSPSLIGVLAVLAVIPWALKWAAPRIRGRLGKKME